MHVKTGLDDIQNYLADASNMPGGTAERLFVPESADEVAEILREADEKRIPVTISGGRTGTVGGAIPFGGYIVSMERMNRIISIDKNAMTATVQPGVILAEFQKAVDSEGLFYPPDPTEWSCQLGGTVATNASGSRSFKYGATREYVNRLQVVLPSGETVDLERGKTIAENGRLAFTTSGGRWVELLVPSYERPRIRKNVSGYFNSEPLDAVDLFVGSEGTLGVITEITLRLLKRPTGLFSGIVFFKREADLLGFVNEARTLSFASRSRHVKQSAAADDADTPTGIDASLLEYFDDRALKFISAKFPETPEEMAGAIFFEQETTAESEDELFSAWNELLEKYNADLDRSWFTTTDEDRDKMRAFRHALPVSVNEVIARHGQRKVGTDMAVPDEAFPSFLQFYKEILNASGLDYVIFGHIGDCHLHANMLPKDANEAERARHIYGRCIAQAIMLGGAVSAEHGIGKLKRKYLGAMMGERYLNEMAEVKGALDPRGILGRGNMFDETYL